MKTALFVAAFALAVLAFSARAEDQPAASQWVVTFGCQKCTFNNGGDQCAPAAKTADGKVYVLGMDPQFANYHTSAGLYVVKGTLLADGKTIKVASITKKDMVDLQK